MRDLLTNYLTYMRIEKNASPLTTYSYRLELDKFCQYLIMCKIYDPAIITTSLVRKYLFTAKDTRNICSSSLFKIINILKSFFRYLSEEDIIIDNPTKKIKVPRKPLRIPTIISKYEIDKILGSIKFAPRRCNKNSVRDKLILSMLYYTGIRRSELLALDWDDLNLEKSTILIRHGKGNKDRIIPIHPDLNVLIDCYLDLRLPLKDKALFIGESGGRLCKCSFSNLLKMYLELSGLKDKGYSAHSFRHSFATHLIECKPSPPMNHF